AIDKDEPALVRQRREQHEPMLPHNDAAAFRRGLQANLRIGDDISAVVGVSLEMLLHRMACDTARRARAQHVGRGANLRSAAALEHDPQAGRVLIDRLHLRAVLDLDAAAAQMLAQNFLCAPLRQAALKLIFATNPRETRAHDLLQTGAEELNVPDVHAGAQERLDQTAPVDDLEHAGLQRSPARLVMRRKEALDDARLDAVAKKLAR